MNRFQRDLLTLSKILKNIRADLTKGFNLSGGRINTLAQSSKPSLYQGTADRNSPVAGTNTLTPRLDLPRRERLREWNRTIDAVKHRIKTLPYIKPSQGFCAAYLYQGKQPICSTNIGHLTPFKTEVSNDITPPTAT